MGVISRRVLPVCGSICIFCPSLRARSRQPVKRYKKLLTDIFPRNQVKFAIFFLLASEFCIIAFVVVWLMSFFGYYFFQFAMLLYWMFLLITGYVFCFLPMNQLEFGWLLFFTLRYITQRHRCKQFKMVRWIQYLCSRYYVVLWV